LVKLKENMSKDVFIVDGLRSPIGSFGGTLSTIRPDDLAAIVIKGLMDRHPNLDPLLIE
jgi:acetyl-CoA acetyltransferase